MTDGPATPPTVLVVEDEPLIAMMVEDAVAGAGYRPLWAPDGRADGPRPGGGGHGAAAAPRAAVVDLRLADGLDGRRVVRRLRERDPSLPVVVATGLHPGAPEADLRGLGGPTVRLAKPFDPGELAACLAAMLGGPAAAAAAADPAAAPRRRASDAPAPSG